MRKIILFLSILISISCFGQTDTTKWLRAFPITAYIVEMNDTTKLVQLQMPDGFSLNVKQPGVVWGVYDGSKETAIEKGYGRCNLIKGDYYYFTISNNKSGMPLKEGDLLYTMMDKTDIFYGQGPKLASHFIRLQNVYEEPLFDRYNIFTYWTEQEEQNLIDSMVSDIQFTGKYFIENNPSMDKPIISGDYKGQKTLYVMAECQPVDVRKFLDYVIARPRLYAGRDWKISEIFATWLSEGAPTIIRQ